MWQSLERDMEFSVAARNREDFGRGHGHHTCIIRAGMNGLGLDGNVNPWS